ncbi:MAG TPA: hypothetical protein VHL98_22495 [Microvirga sp.]|jgi:hypothetical protein|nr:hypothetical protein [Microvirga sp.]
MDYRLYLLTTEGRIEGVAIIECEDEATAVQAARERASSDGYSIELWQRSRRIGHFPQNGLPAVGPGFAR